VLVCMCVRVVCMVVGGVEQQTKYNRRNIWRRMGKTKWNYERKWDKSEREVKSDEG